MASTSNVPPPGHALLSVFSTEGVFLFGTFFGIMLYGFGLHQSFAYSRSSHDDTLLLKVLVAAVMICETAHVIVTIHSCYYYLIANYLNPLAMKHGVWSLDILPLISGITMFMSQLVLARRVYLVGPRHRIVVRFAMTFLAGEVGVSIAAAVQSFIPTQHQLMDVTFLNGIGLGLAWLGESGLTFALTLAFQESRLEAPRPESFEEKMDVGVLYLVNTGLITCIFNLAGFVTALARPASFVYASINIITTRLYGNSLLAVLNSRSMTGMELFSTKTKTNTFMAAFADAEGKAARQQWNVPQLVQHPDAAVINIEVETETDYMFRYADTKRNTEIV